jgi:Family of unknown function (DUF5681)
MPFKKGKTGNPKGRPTGAVNKVGADLRAAARLYTDDAFATIVAIMNDKKEAASVRQRAAEFVIERGWGKAIQPVDVVKPVYVIADRPISPDEWATKYADPAPARSGVDAPRRPAKRAR